MASRLELVLPEPWEPDVTRPMAWQWGTASVEAQWLVEDDQCSLHLVLTTPDEITAPGPLLVTTSGWPHQRMTVSPRHSAVLFDPGHADEVVLVFSPIHRAGDWAHPLDGSTFRVGGSRLARTLVWQASWIDSTAGLARLLPGWYPRRVHGAGGEEVSIPLPDAGVDTDLEVVLADDGVVVALAEGAHTVLVHEAGGTSRVRLWGPSPPSSLSADPGAWSVDELTAAALRGVAPDLVAAGVEEWLHHPGPVDPLLVVAAAILAIATADPGHVQLVLEGLDRMSPTPGALLAHARAAVTLHLLGAAPPAAPAEPLGAEDGVARTCHRAEWAVLSGAPRPGHDVARVLGLWGRGLPVDQLDAQVAAPWVALLRVAPEHWSVGERWLLPAAEVAQAVEARLRSEPGTTGLAWLDL